MEVGGNANVDVKDVSGNKNGEYVGGKPCVL